MGEKILKTNLVILLIITMTMANVILIGLNCYTYAVETISEGRVTSNKNVEFMSYFKNDKGDIFSEYDVKMNANNLKFYFKVIVKQEGYFNGNVTISNANFKLVEENTNNDIAKIEGNKIFLNQINAGEEKEFEIGIELLKEDKYQKDMLNRNSEVSLEGIYRDSKQKDIKVNGTRNVKLNIVDPYNDNTESPVILEQKVITNKLFKEAGQKKRIIQMQIETGLANNLYPVKNLNLEINVPRVKGNKPNKVEVITPEKLMMTDKKIEDSQITYDEINGVITLNIENILEEGKANWKKEGLDTFIVTYVFDGENKIEEQNSITKAQYNLFDINNSRYNKEIERTILADEIDSIVELKVDSQEKEIYKGKIYSNIERSFVENLHVQVNALEIATGVIFEEDFGNTKLNIESKGIRINKNELIDLLGQDGKVIIKEKTNNNVLAEINNSSKENEKGEIIIAFPENIKEIMFETSKPQKIGIINIDKVNVIKATDKNIAKNESIIEYKLNGKYLINDIENPIDEVNSVINLKESETSARIEINKEELSTMVVNKNVEIKVILESSNEKNDLYKNPVIRIELPEKIKDIKLNSINLLNSEELEIKGYNLVDKTILIELKNEQTRYNDLSIKDVEILISLDIELEKRQKNSTEEIRLMYINEKANLYKNGNNVGEEIKNIDIISYLGVISEATIGEYGINVLNNQGNKTGKLSLGEDNKKATFTSKVINNQEKAMYEVNIIGAFPTRDAVNNNNIDIVVGDINLVGLPIDRYKIYYSENEKATHDLNKVENAWKEQISDRSKVKKYLISVDKLENYEEFDFKYDMAIPKNLEYNRQAEEGYDIYYKVSGIDTEQHVKNELLSLETGLGPVAEVELRATVGGEMATKAKEGEFIHYEVIIKNMGTENIQNVNVIGSVPEGTIYVEEKNNNVNGKVHNLGFVEEQNKKSVEVNIKNLEAGKERIFEYDVKVQNSKVNIVENDIKINYGEVNKNSNKVKTEVFKGDISIAIESNEDKGFVLSNTGYRFIINVKNHSAKILKNIRIRPKLENAKIIDAFMEQKDENDEIVVKDFNNFEEMLIDQLKPNESVKVAVKIIVNDFQDNIERYIKLNANLLVDDAVYRSNIKKVKVKNMLIDLTNKSQNDGEYVKEGDKIQYKITISNIGDNRVEEVILRDVISIYESFVSVSINGRELTKQEYSEYPEITGNGKVIEIRTDLNPDERKEYIIETLINKIEGNKEIIQVENKADINYLGVNNRVAEVIHFLEPEKEEVVEPEEPDKPINPDKPVDPNKPVDPDKPDKPDKPVNPDKPVKPDKNFYRIISGYAWLDKNDNSEKDLGDENLSDIKVKILNVETNDFLRDKKGNVIEKLTNKSGFYCFDKVPEGKYVLLFEYDVLKYQTVTYKKQGVSEQKNSNVICREMNMQGEILKVAVTDVISLYDKNIANLNIGLKETKIFDLRLDKYVSRIIVNNAKELKTYEFGETTLAKADINAREINSTNVIVEYKIKVTNEGEIPGYVKKIEDKVAKDYKFNSEMNKNWYKTGEVLENSSLANTKINPGESKEVSLILTKQMTENNIGLINNTAEIVEDYNELGIKDNDSIPGNYIDEDDRGTCDVILSIKTGEIVMIVFTVAILIFALSLSAYFIILTKIKKKVI